MDKVFASPAEAVADVPDGASIAISGFGLSSGVPNSFLAGAAERGSSSLKDLCLVANGVGGAAAQLIEFRGSSQHFNPSLARYRRASDVPRTYDGKPAWTRAQMAERAAAHCPSRAYGHGLDGAPRQPRPCQTGALVHVSADEQSR